MTILKIAHTSDNHIGPDRFDENRQALEWLVEDINAQECAITTIAGDFFDKRAREEDLWLGSRTLAQLQTEVLILMGNHGTQKGLEVLAQCQSGQGSRVRVIFHPTVVELEGIAFYCLPHMDKANLQLCMEATGIVDTQLAFNEAVAAIVHFMATDSQQRPGPKMLLGHFTVQGCQLSNGQELYDPGLTQGFGVTLGMLTGFNCLLMSIGHIHMAQMLTKKPCPIFYNGGHSRFNFGETEEKGYWISTIDTEQNRLVDLVFRKNPHAPRLVTETYRFDGSDWNLISPDQEYQDAEVRILAEYLEGTQPDFTELIDFYESNCRKWTLERKLITITKTRCSEIATANTPQEQIRLFWQHTPDSAPPETERPAILELLDETVERIRTYGS